MMTRKDYEAIARIMQSTNASRPLSVHPRFITSIVEKLADYMEYDNPNFQRTRFLEACEEIHPDHLNRLSR